VWNIPGGPLSLIPSSRNLCSGAGAIAEPPGSRRREGTNLTELWTTPRVRILRTWHSDGWRLTVGNVIRRSHIHVNDLVLWVAAPILRLNISGLSYVWKEYVLCFCTIFWTMRPYINVFWGFRILVSCFFFFLPRSSCYSANASLNTEDRIPNRSQFIHSLLQTSSHSWSPGTQRVKHSKQIIHRASTIIIRITIVNCRWF
jgi:hypothetical protein